MARSDCSEEPGSGWVTWTQESQLCFLSVSYASQSCIRYLYANSGGTVVKNLPANTGDPSSIPESGRSPGEGNVNPLQYSCLGNPKGQEAAGYSPWGIKRVGHNLATKQQQSPPTRDQTLVPSIARQTLNHRTTRQVSHKLLFPSSLERGS